MMFAPELTENAFNEHVSNGLTTLTRLSDLNSKNCKADFSKTIPKALRDEDWTSILVIKNHKGRWKYLGFNMEDSTGSLKITNNPDLLWTGYVLHDGNWYAVTTEDMIRKRVKFSSRIIPPEIEH